MGRMTDTISTQCQRKVVGMMPACIIGYGFPAWASDDFARLNPVVELTTIGKFYWLVSNKMVMDGFRSLVLPDIGWSVIGRAVLTFMMIPISVIVIIHLYELLKQFRGGGGGPKPPSGRYEGIMSGIRRMRGG